MTKFFLPQATLEEWVTSNKADLQGGQLVLTAERISLRATPAVWFVKLVSGADEKKLISKVKTSEQLKELGAEQVADSVILGDSAYEVAPGYVTTSGATVEQKAGGETDLLAEFLLKKMSGP